MKKLSILLTTFILLYFSMSLRAQSVQRCNAPAILDDLSPEVYAATLQSRDQVNARHNLPVSTLRQRCHRTFHIPVVFHVIHNRSTDSISAAQIQTQMTVLNEDFRKKASTPAFGSGVDANIEFHLATRDPQGFLTTGITYTKDSIANFTYNRANDSLLKTKIKWPQQSYLNIWVVDTIMYGNSYIIGYAHFPSAGKNPLDGIVIADQHVGRDTGTAITPPYNKGRSITHEAGHALGLYHPFDYYTAPCEGNTDTTCATQGDFVCDVPPHANPHFGCPSSPQNTCTEYPKDTNDYVYNFMEYTNDSCANMFSQGQADRMHNTLDTDSFRLILVSTQNLIQTGVTFHGQPDPDFFPIGSSCIYDSLWLYNQTLGVGPQGFPYPDTKWMWSLPGGIPDTSNAQHPFVVYQDTGYYMITLTVMNSFGQCMYPVTVYISGPDLSVGSNVVNIGDSTGFFTFSGETGTWLWNFGDGSLDSIGHGPFPYHTYGSVGTYIYTATFLPDDTLQCVVNMRDTARVTSLPLAAGLLDFQGAYTEQQAVALNWRSLPDQGLDHFLLERSLNGSHFQQIAQIPGRAGSAGLLRYAYLDDGAPLRPSWYRLWPVDREGQLGEHALIAVAPPRALHLDFWPNPAQDNLHLAVFSPERELPIQLRICDVLGQNVLERQLLAGKGKQDFTLSLENLPAGVYLVRAWNPRSGKVLAQEKLLIH